VAKLAKHQQSQQSIIGFCKKKDLK